jgi:ParB-like chromosome segregation protein Spo0J
MPPRIRKRTATKAVAPRVSNFLFESSEPVAIGSLKPHPENPRMGDVDDIAQSLTDHGQFKPIVVNKRAPMKNVIAAGHHTWLAARRLGWPQIGVVYIDVDADEHKRIMLIDNASTDSASYDFRIQAKVLNELAKTQLGLKGTGFDDAYLKELNSSLAELADKTLTDAQRAEAERQQAERLLRRSKTFDGAPLGEEPEPDTDEDYDDDVDDSSGKVLRRKPDEDGPDLRDAKEELGGMVQFKPPSDIQFGGYGYWGVTKLRTDMLMEFDELPANFETWAGSATKDWPDDETWWFYNYGVDSTSGMKDISKMVLGFYTHDEYFENWWHYPERFAAKLVNSGVKYAVTPNYSQWPQDPHVLNLWNLHRSRWVGRYLQEAGIKVIPDVNWPAGDEKFLKDFVLASLPKGDDLPMVSFQMQTYDPKTVDEKLLRKLIQLVFDTLEPGGLLLYAGEPGQEFFDKYIKTGCPIRKLDTRMRKLSEQAKGRQRKTTL